jgi:hypothetical protein
MALNLIKQNACGHNYEYHKISRISISTVMVTVVVESFKDEAAKNSQLAPADQLTVQIRKADLDMNAPLHNQIYEKLKEDKLAGATDC